MPSITARFNRVEIRILAFLAANLLLAFCIYQSILKLREAYYRLLALHHISFYCFVAFISILLGWFALKKIGAFITVMIASGAAILCAIVMQEGWLVIFPFSYLCFFLLIRIVEKRYSDECVIREVEIEKQLAEKNDLELSFIEKGKGISVCFEKYSTYYNLRRLADEFSTTFVLPDLGNIIVNRTLEFIQRGDSCLLFLASNERDQISLLASKYSNASRKKPHRKLGDLFDFWVLRNRQHLLVNDLQNDFRFDLRKTTLVENIASIILAPLTHEGKVVGTLRINSEKTDTFTTDHLRLLDAISTLASSALSNALLYQKTEELAIRDSLTNLYVHRYFLDRLKHEHRRALLNHESLSLLMCDLDHFKNINDHYGHAIGDLALQRVAQVLRKLGEHAIVARYGGEEFAILAPQMTKAEALQLAEKIRKQVEAEKIEVRRDVVPVTVSIGVGNIPDDTLDAEELIKLADARLYQAKNQGRNRVC